MGISELIIISVGLSLGSFAASLSAGSLDNVSKIEALKIAFAFGLFQAIMSVLGWLAGFSLISFVEYYLLWFSFSIIFIIGLKMIFESIKVNPEERKFDIIKNSVLILMALASSIDAFIIGISFGFFNTNIFNMSIIIGIITFFFSFGGVFLGKSNWFVKPSAARFSGGLILIFVAVKILIEYKK